MQIITIQIKKKRCSECKQWFDEEAFFHRNYQSVLHACNRDGSRPKCIGCEDEARNVPKQCDRWTSKARDTIRRHATRFGMNSADFCRTYRWSVERLAHDLKHGYDNTCPYCRRPYDGMGHGPADITIDIIDPARPPLYDTNVKHCCGTCNKEKSQTPPELWARKLICWDQWTEWKRNGQSLLPQFQQVSLIPVHGSRLEVVKRMNQMPEINTLHGSYTLVQATFL
jgi:hypothetical protein